MSTDRGSNWVPIQHFVKAFYWSPYRVLLVERIEPTETNTVWKLDIQYLLWYQTRHPSSLRIRPALRREFAVVIENVEDFQIKGDYMFAIKNSKASMMLSCIESFFFAKYNLDC